MTLRASISATTGPRNSASRRRTLRTSNWGSASPSSVSFAVYDFSFVVLGYQNDHYHQPLTVPPYSGITQPIDINVNADIRYRESLTQDFPQVVPPYAPTAAPLSTNEPGNEPE